MLKLLERLGADLQWDKDAGIIHTSASSRLRTEAEYELVSKMRASFLVMGPLLARLGEVNVPLPGGCAIGARPVDLHLKGFCALGAEVVQEHGNVSAKAKRLKGARIYLDFPSVGATENIMMAAVLADGVTVLENCAVEPEIVDLANFLNSAGAEVRGAGTDTIKIIGVKSISKADHSVIPDRIEAGTFMVAAGVTKGDITVTNVVADHLKPLIAKLKEVNLNVEETEAGLRVYYKEGRRLIATDVKTLPYPGFPTDMQAQFMSLLILAEGTSIVTETVFENRFMHVGEFKRMGADIKIESRSAIIEGVKKLMGAQVKATDLRAGAALALAALTASGTTELSDIYHIDRGYCNLAEKLSQLGAMIHREEDFSEKNC
jgi:UDP-N-acetylglucosamine 1-carboxyvinyltransferase